MNKAQFLLNLCETDQDEWGFDLTNISASNWKKVLSAVGISSKPNLKDEVWVWEAPGITIHTGNDPITGKYSRHDKREDEEGFASYIGVYGDKDKVKKVASMIHKLASYIKEENPHQSHYI